jgi:hypothetical protein
MHFSQSKNARLLNQYLQGIFLQLKMRIQAHPWLKNDFSK